MWEVAGHLAVAGDVFGGDFLYCPFFWDLIESVSEGFPTYIFMSSDGKVFLLFLFHNRK